MSTITITHDDETKLMANEYQDCLECNEKYNLSKLRVGFEVENHECGHRSQRRGAAMPARLYAFVECPHCQNETIIPIY